MLESEQDEKHVQITLENLDKDFSGLMFAVRSSLDHKIQHQQLVLVDFIRWIEHRMKWVGELSDINNLNELFKKLHPFFDFIDCGIIVDTSEKFLNDEYIGTSEDKKNLVSELKEHMERAKFLRDSKTVKQLSNHLHGIYFPYVHDIANMPCIYIKLHNTWNEANIEGLYLVIRHLLPHRSKQSILKYIEIATGSVCIKYIVLESKADRIIAYAQSKLQFIRLIGIFSLSINDESIMKENENISFSFESALLEAVRIGHNEAVEFLLKLQDDVDHYNYNGKGGTILMLASEVGYEQIVQTPTFKIIKGRQHLWRRVTSIILE